MKVKQLARTIVRTTALVLGLLALLSLAGALCLGSLMLVARDPGIPPYSMTCTFQPAQSPAAACVASVFARNAFKTNASRLPSSGKLAALGDDFRVEVYDSRSQRLVFVELQPVDFSSPVEAFIDEQRPLRAALRKLTNDLRDSCAPDAQITCQTCSVEAGCHEWN